MATAPNSNAAPRAVWILFSAEGLRPMRCRRYAPRKAIGTEPSTIQPTSARFTVPLRRCTAAPKGRMSTAATRSLEIAVEVPCELFADFQASCLFPLHQVGVNAGVAVVPAPFPARALAQLKRVLIAAPHAQHGGAEDKQLRDLGLRSTFGNEEDAVQTHRGSQPGAG